MKELNLIQNAFYANLDRQINLFLNAHDRYAFTNPKSFTRYLESVECINDTFATMTGQLVDEPNRDDIVQSTYKFSGFLKTYIADIIDEVDYIFEDVREARLTGNGQFSF